MTDVSAVLFDMDGTLVDSDAVVARAWHVPGADFNVAHLADLCTPA